jgi:hypothetical protein
VGPASRPLPLFYALTQASKAIVAAYGNGADTKSHGLGEDRRAVFPEKPTDLLALWLKRAAGSRDTLSGLVAATASGDLPSRVQLGAVWAAIPGTPRLPRESWRSDWRTCLSVSDVHDPTLRGRGTFQVLAIEEPSDILAGHFEDVGTPRYPGLPEGAKIALHRAGVGELRYAKAFLTWSDRSIRLKDIGSAGYGSTSHRVLRPLLPGQLELSSPLVLWWTLLCGLAILARYEPAAWQAALRVDESQLAISLEWVMETALREMPGLVYRALTQMADG